VRTCTAGQGGTSHHTPLHAAAWNGDPASVRLLLDAGAHPAARDDEHDSTPLGWAETALRITGNADGLAVADDLRGIG
jgi:hypothetical protein